MKLFPVLALIATALLGRACFAQAVLTTELGGLRLPPAGSQSVDTNATFAVGLTTDGTTWRHGAGPADVIRVVGRVRPEAAQVGTRADLFLVVAVEGKFLMRSSNGAFLPWSGQMSDLLFPDRHAADGRHRSGVVQRRTRQQRQLPALRGLSRRRRRAALQPAALCAGNRRGS